MWMCIYHHGAIGVMRHGVSNGADYPAKIKKLTGKKTRSSEPEDSRFQDFGNWPSLFIL